VPATGANAHFRPAKPHEKPRRVKYGSALLSAPERDSVWLPAVQTGAPGPARADGREQEKITFLDEAATVYLVQQQRD